MQMGFSIKQVAPYYQASMTTRKTIKRKMIFAMAVFHPRFTIFHTGSACPYINLPIID